VLFNARTEGNLDATTSCKKFQSTHIPGTASFLNSCGDTTVSDG
jgi:hypothetical protein